MDNFRILALFLFSAVLLVSCNDTENMEGLIDATERAIMNDCRNQSLSSASDIKESLIGDWELIGFGHGWFASTPKPCASLNFTENEIRYVGEDEIIVSTYTIEVNDNGNAFLNIDERVPFWVSTFCDKYMFGDATPVDGNMYLFEKID